ncbi:MAG TPA: cysteine rich repeat-containing protein [Bdellovibrio sp.]|nr:cysteine rich repeat-containing protein [Bdellovibrio sp.]
MRKWIVMTLITTAFGFQVQAQTPPPAGPCAKDKETLCAGIEGRGNVMKCLKDNSAKISTECKEHVEKMKKVMKEVHEACHDDYEKFCDNVEPGKGRIKKCMKEHKSDLSQTCQDAIAKNKHHKKG